MSRGRPRLFFVVRQVTKSTILDQFRPTILLLILPTLHLVLCFYVEFSISDNAGGWKWFLVGLVDYPASSILKQVGFLDPLLTFGIFGTLWWYLISVFLRWIFGVGASIANR